MAEVESENQIASGPDWDALAPYWHHFEHGGFNMELVRKYKDGLVAPLLFIGGARGIYAKPFVDQLGAENVVIVDASMAMAARGRREFDLDYLVADLLHLPCARGTFNSVVCPTGIIEALNEEALGAGLGEISRVLVRGGVALVACMSLAQSRANPSSQVHIDVHHAIDEWYHADAATALASPGFAAYSSLAHDLGDRDTARSLLRRALPRWTCIWTLSGFAAAARSAGFRVDSVSEERSSSIAVWQLTHASP